MSVFSQGLGDYYRRLQPPGRLPAGISALFPFREVAVREAVMTFIDRYFSAPGKRRLLLGINPGRKGAGITGINFTAPRQLREACGIEHPFGDGSELSAEFIYRVIAACGGPKAFYRHWFIGAVCPIGFVKRGKNINYYDDPRLQKAVMPYIIREMEQLLALGFQRDRCLCVGGEKNFRFLQQLNEIHHWFEEIVPLPHPRFILQYRRKQADAYMEQYLQALGLPKS
jgi:hypothetical protein